MKKSKAKSQQHQQPSPERTEMPQESIKVGELSPDYIWIKNANKENLGGLNKQKVLDIFNEELKKEVVCNTVIRQILKTYGLEWEQSLVSRIKKQLEEKWIELYKKE
jgi:hypothetical protein